MKAALSIGSMRCTPKDAGSSTRHKWQYLGSIRRVADLDGTNARTPVKIVVQFRRRSSYGDRGRSVGARLVSAMPSGPSDQRRADRRDCATIPPPIGSFLLTSKQDVDSIVAQQHRCRTNCIQLCDRLTTGSLQALKAAMPGVSMVQVVHVTGPESVEEAIAVASGVDAILLDSGNQSRAIKELGGTGRRHSSSPAANSRAGEHPDFSGGRAEGGERC
jgi:hypothetical protein